MRFNADTLSKSLQLDLEHMVGSVGHSWSIDNSPTLVACYRLRDSLLKKFNNESRPSEEASNAALEKFLAVNERVSNWELVLNHVSDWELVGELKLELARLFDSDTPSCRALTNYSSIFSAGTAGPGASLGALGCDFYTKMFASTLTCTKPLADVWQLLVPTDPSFREAYSDPAWVHGLRVVDQSHLSFVNKNHDIARTICTEPSINMWMQLGLGRLMHSRLKSVYGIDFSYQAEVNRALAIASSYSDHLSTIDLESASDSLGIRMLNEVLPKNLLAMLHKLRTPSTMLPTGSNVPLNMISTMGNGFTFPLQTSLFMASCVVCYRYLGIPYRLDGPHPLRNVSVFGDDIVVDKRVYRLLTRLLGILGFSVNRDKSYVEGPFRESCGVDAFLGVNVRPVYIRKLRSLQDAFVAINLLNLWSSRFGIPLRNTVQYIISCFPRVMDCPVPPDEDDAAGLKLPRCLVPTCNYVKNGFGLLRYTKSMPAFHGYRVSENGRLIKHPRKATSNPSGLWAAFLGGYITGMRVSLRQNETRYLTRRMVTPSWGSFRPGTLFEFPDRDERFRRAVLQNI